MPSPHESLQPQAPTGESGRLQSPRSHRPPNGTPSPPDNPPRPGNPPRPASAGLARGFSRIPNWHVLVQFVKFGIVGISNTLIAFAVYTVLLKVFGVWYIAASGIGFAVGAVNGFLLNRRWTFREHVGDPLTPVRWAIVQSCGLGCNLGLVYLFVHGAGMDKLVGQIPATAMVTVLTFIANRAWTFRVREPATGSV